MADYFTTPLWRWRIWKRFHNLRCTECRPCYTFWRLRVVPLEQRR